MNDDFQTTAQWLQVGEYIISRYHDEDYWIEYRTGEGMQVFRKNFEDLIDRFFKEYF